MAVSDKIYSIKLEETDVPGAKFRCSDVSEHSVVELKRWLECRGMLQAGTKPELVKRCLECIESKNTDIIISVDGGIWYEEKVREVLSTARSKSSADMIPLLPTSGWQKFPSGSIPKGFCYGRIYEHIILTAKVYEKKSKTSTSDSESEDNLTDFNTSKPMVKGRQYFASGHVKDIKSIAKGEYFFVKSTVMASYTQQKLYHVTLTLGSPSGKILDASCDCKASAMGRCNHIASLLFALEDYTLQFGYDPDACTSKLCTWNVGRKAKRQPQPCYSTSYNKKLKADRYRNYNPMTTKLDETKFANEFIATLPNSGSYCMFDQILEIEYSDYVVDIKNLNERTNYSLNLIKQDASEPYEVPNTDRQAESIMWHSSRNCRITASVAKEVSSVKSLRAKYNLLERILWGKKLPQLKSLKYGQENEDNAFTQYVNLSKGNNETTRKSGFWINPEYPELGCSPDGLIYDANNNLIGVLEIKCPLVLKDKDPLCIESLKPCQRFNLCYTIENGILSLKKTHKYYAQVQMQMGLCNVKFCDFVIWSSAKTLIQRIHFDGEYWHDLRDKLILFHHKCMMPEYLEMRIPRKLLPVEL
ncbi:uncharacterized protein LOC125647675 [Ostrea edulis]|uniref:uncharacterized protein LOC125647675 n=1 Tax=Ostrea edulis TaxID=37623 RepID=UPI0024AEEA36|nr:uncharacterized protein LOC125647675 [Ostrea edulis]